MSKCSIVVFALTLTLSAAQTFEWFAESPRNCARDPTQCCGSACRGDRDVYCRVRGTNAPISPLFCADTPNPYSSRVDCNETECPRDCVVSEWSSWGACSATCGNLTTEYRSRRVFVPPEAGRSCPDLSQTRKCRNATLRLPCPAHMASSSTAFISYLWRLGHWSSCLSIGRNGSDCGLGLIFRVVNCVATNESVVEDTKCKSNRRETSPISRQACNFRAIAKSISGRRGRIAQQSATRILQALILIYHIANALDPSFERVNLSELRAQLFLSDNPVTSIPFLIARVMSGTILRGSTVILTSLAPSSASWKTTQLIPPLAIVFARANFSHLAL